MHPWIHRDPAVHSILEVQLVQLVPMFLEDQLDPYILVDLLVPYHLQDLYHQAGLSGPMVPMDQVVQVNQYFPCLPGYQADLSFQVVLDNLLHQYLPKVLKDQEGQQIQVDLDIPMIQFLRCFQEVRPLQPLRYHHCLRESLVVL